jgi:serine/threonine protein kinase
MLDTAGVVRVLDLGLARIVDAANPFSKSTAGRLTQSGMYMGTVDYMAPEQAEDSHRVDRRADIYSLGCTLYYLLTGKEPFLGETVLKRLIAHMERPAPSLRTARPDVPPALDEAYQKMMAKRPEERPASMAEVISLLEPCKRAAAEAKMQTVVPPKSKPELMVFDEAPLKRAGAPGTKAEPSIFPRPKEPEGLVLGHELSLEDLVMDVRPEAPLTPLRAASRPAPAKTQPLKRMSSTRSRGRPKRQGLVVLALAAAGVLGVVLVRLAMFRGPARDNAPARANALAATASPNAEEKTAPEPESANPIRLQPTASKPTSRPPTDLKREGAFRFPQHQATVQSLLNGKDLTGWFVDSGVGNTWLVEDGDLVVTSARDYRKPGWLLSERSFSDFILRFEFQLSKGANSGVALRAESGDRVGNLPVHPEVSLVDSDKRLEETGTFKWSNSIRPQDWLPLDRRSHLNPAGSWNELDIELRGQALRVRINDSDVLTRNLRQLAALPEALPGVRRESGRVGFQAHTGTVRFRNIRIEELTATPAKPVDGDDMVAGGRPQQIASPSFFNGKNLTGWEGLKGYWSVRDGAIVGSCPPGSPVHTFLCSKRSYTDFELRFKVKLMDGIGNSGVQFRSRITDRGRFRTSGPQCEIAEVTHRYPPGSLVTEPGGPAIAAPRERVLELYKAADFNEFSIRCVGKHVTIRVNGVTSVDDDWPTMPSEGIIAWQIHEANTPREVVFKDVTLVDLTPRRAD